MKSLATLIILAIVGYALYTYYDSSTDNGPLSYVARHARDIVPEPPSPTPTPEAPVVQVPEPDLAYVPVAREAALTHAQVKDIRLDGLLFMCDQGVFEIPYNKLPPQFRAHYGPIAARRAAKEAEKAAAAQAAAAQGSSTDGAAAAPTSAPPPPAPAPRPQRSVADDLQARQNYITSRASLEERVQHDQSVIDQYRTQSTFEAQVTPLQYETAKTDLEIANAQLAQVIANGPSQ